MRVSAPSCMKESSGFFLKQQFKFASLEGGTTALERNYARRGRLKLPKQAMMLLRRAQELEVETRGVRTAVAVAAENRLKKLVVVGPHARHAELAGDVARAAGLGDEPTKHMTGLEGALGGAPRGSTGPAKTVLLLDAYSLLGQNPVTQRDLDNLWEMSQELGLAAVVMVDSAGMRGKQLVDWGFVGSNQAQLQDKTKFGDGCSVLYAPFQRPQLPTGEQALLPRGEPALTALILPPAAVTYAAGSGGQPVPQAWGLAANLTKSVVLAGSEAHAAAAMQELAGAQRILLLDQSNQVQKHAYLQRCEREHPGTVCPAQLESTAAAAAAGPGPNGWAVPLAILEGAPETFQLKKRDELFRLDPSITGFPANESPALLVRCTVYAPVSGCQPPLTDSSTWFGSGGGAQLGKASGGAQLAALAAFELEVPLAGVNSTNTRQAGLLCKAALADSEVKGRLPAPPHGCKHGSKSSRRNKAKGKELRTGHGNKDTFVAITKVRYRNRAGGPDSRLIHTQPHPCTACRYPLGAGYWRAGRSGGMVPQLWGRVGRGFR